MGFDPLTKRDVLRINAWVNDSEFPISVTTANNTISTFACIYIYVYVHIHIYINIYINVYILTTHTSICLQR
jgi:cytochrome b subunit of formate dehydrogenase